MNFINHYYQNIGENWFSYARLYSDAVFYFADDSLFVEIGSWRGRSSCFMAVEINNSGKSIKLDCIDTWEGSIEHKDHDLVIKKDLYQEFLNNIEPVKHIINPRRIDSLSASKLYEDNSIDFLFIDASHEYDDVKKDIEHWYPKVKLGGIIAGHDYNPDWSGVVRAVDEFFANKDFVKSQDCWIHRKFL